MPRVFPRTVYTRRSPNQSRRSSPITSIVLHSTESHNRPRTSSDLRQLADYLCQPSVQASSHVVVDGDGHSARIVADSAKAWTCGAFNSPTLNIEQIGVAASEKWTEAELRETARWIARWSRLHGIPIRVGRVSGGTITRTGVLTHSQLGALGGGHTDPGGPNKRYPKHRVLMYARAYKLAQIARLKRR